MRLFPEFATALICVGVMAGCQNSNKSVTTDLPASDQTRTADNLNSMGRAAPALAAAGTAPVVPMASGSATETGITATTATPKATFKSARHGKKRSRAIAHHKRHRHGKSVVVTTKSPSVVASADAPQSDRQAERDEFKRLMESRVLKIGNAVSRYHNSASITDGLSRYEQKIEDVKIADALARKQLENVATVSNDNWPTFRSTFQDQVSQLERDYQGIRTAKR